MVSTALTIVESTGLPAAFLKLLGQVTVRELAGPDGQYL